MYSRTRASRGRTPSRSTPMPVRPAGERKTTKVCREFGPPSVNGGDARQADAAGPGGAARDQVHHARVAFGDALVAAGGGCSCGSRCTVVKLYGASVATRPPES